MTGTPVGEFALASDGAAICAARFGEIPMRASTDSDALLDAAVAQITAYFRGERTDFDLPLVVTGGSEFERAVWEQLRLIPYGRTMTYGEVAAAVGERGAARAVGVACNRNPLPLVVPCHRVMGAGGKLVGFGGGIPAKVALLELELRVAVESGLGI